MSDVGYRNAFTAALGLVLVSAAAPIAFADPPGYLFRDLGASINVSDNARIASDAQIAATSRKADQGLATARRRAASTRARDNVFVNGRYHSVMNGIADYDGFDRFRDANGQPLPGWEQELSNPG